MKKIFIPAVIFAVLLCYGCGNRTAPKTQSADHKQAKAASCGHDHDHSGHNHEKHNHHDNSHDGHDHNHDDHGHDKACGKESGRSARKAARQAAREAHAGHNHGHDHGGGNAVNFDEIVFPADQAARTNFKVITAKKGDFRETIKCGGEITAAQSGLSVVAAPVSGIVTFVDGRIMQNTRVNAGQELFRITSSGLASGDAVERARIAYEQAQADFERAEKMYAANLITNKEYNAAKADYLRANSEYEPLSGSNSGKGVAVLSPMGGYVRSISAAHGDFVEIGQPLASIAASNRMQLKALVSQRYYGSIGSFTDANFRIPSSDGYLNVKSLNGRLQVAGQMTGPGSTLIPIIFEFDNNGNIPDGTFAEVILLGGERSGVMTLPLTAVTEQQGLYYAYVQIDGEHYSRRELKLGANDGVNVEILSGIEEGDRVVAVGAVNIKVAAASGSIPHGHTH